MFLYRQSLQNTVEKIERKGQNCFDLCTGGQCIVWIRITFLTEISAGTRQDIQLLVVQREDLFYLQIACKKIMGPRNPTVLKRNHRFNRLFQCLLKIAGNAVGIVIGLVKYLSGTKIMPGDLEPLSR